MFWGVALDAGKRYSQEVEETFHLSMAALESSGKSDEVVQVMLQQDSSEFLLCSLQHGKLLQQPLNLVFNQGQTVTFFLNGSGSVHLTGYVIGDDEALEREEEDPDWDETSMEQEDLSEENSSDESDEEIPDLVQIHGKRKADGKLKKSKKIKLLDDDGNVVDESDDSDDDDESDDDDDSDDEEEEDFSDDFGDSSFFDDEASEDDDEDDDDDEEDDDSEDDDSDEMETSVEQTPQSAKKKNKTPKKEKTPLKEKTPKKEGKTPKKEGKTPKKVEKTPKKEENETPKKEEKTPKKPKTPKGEQNPKQNVKTPKETGKTPKENAKTPKENAKTPKENGKTPKAKNEENANTPVQNGKTPKVNGKTPNIAETPNSQKAKKAATPKVEAATPQSDNQATPTVDGEKKKKKKKNKNKDDSADTSLNQSKADTPQSATKSTPKKRVVSGGTVVEDLKDGHGPEAKAGKMVGVYYKGVLQKNNKQFDSCLAGKPFKFRLNQGEVIKGWDNGVSGMKVGGKRRIIVPANQGYGNKSNGPIPANSVLVFEVELKSVS